MDPTAFNSSHKLCLTIFLCQMAYVHAQEKEGEIKRQRGKTSLNGAWLYCNAFFSISLPHQDPGMFYQTTGGRS